MKFKHLIIAFLLGAACNMQAQDFHNSFFQFAPATINPALTGAFYGNLRVNVIGRDEGRVETNGNGWQALSLMVDYNIDFGFTEGDWISAGATFNRSASAGAGNFRQQFSGLLAAYHLAFGKKQDKVFTVGFKYGTYSSGFRNPNSADYQDPFSLENEGAVSSALGQYLGTLAGQNPEEKSSGDYNLGLMLDAPLGKTADIRIGVSADHMLAPLLSTSTDSTGTTGGLPPVVRRERLDRRINAFVFLYTDISKRLTFNPNILFQKKGVTTNIVAQALFHYLYKPEKELSLIFGLGVRPINNLDLPIYIGMDMKDLRVGLSYDANAGGLSGASNSYGALELGITKIFNWNKKATVKPVFICPRL